MSKFMRLQIASGIATFLILMLYVLDAINGTAFIVLLIIEGLVGAAIGFMFARRGQIGGG